MSRNTWLRRTTYGYLRLAKVEKKLEDLLKLRAKRLKNEYPGAIFHGITMRLPSIKNEQPSITRESLFVAIDDYSRELYAVIVPDKTQYSAAQFLAQVLYECPYTIEQWHTSKGQEYKGNHANHAFMKLCKEHSIEQRFIKVKTPRKNEEAKRVIKTIIKIWDQKTSFKSRRHRKQELTRFINWYNTMKPYKGIESLTPMEKLFLYFYSKKI